MALRIAFTLFAAPACLLLHDILVELYERYATPVKHDMLGTGIAFHFAGWALVLLFPITCWLGDMWWKDRRRYMLNLLLLFALTLFVSANWTTHPYRTLLFLACCWATLPMRWLIDRMTAAQ